jgi:hypothetical protein
VKAKKRRARPVKRKSPRRVVRSRPRAAERRPRPPERPIPGPDAFTDVSTPAHVQSQAATLLLIGNRLRGDAAATEARAAAAPALSDIARAPERAAPVMEAVPNEDLARLGFPGLRPSTVRFSAAALTEAAGRDFRGRPQLRRSRGDVRAATARLPEAARTFYSDANPETAAALLEVSLRHPNQLVRVAAAASYPTVAVNPQAPIRILEEGVQSRDRLVRDVAGHALARLDPRNPVLVRLLASRTRPSHRRPSRTATIVHGTWARDNDWWQPPTGDFWKYLHDNVDATLYGAADRFEWSGGYSDAARGLGGDDLHAWVQQHVLNGLDVFTHSHGGSVAMLATQAGTQIGKLVLLSCPVHWPKYAPDFALVTKVVSIRVHLDLVILADGGGQRFHDARIQENVLSIWFDHFTTHDPATWEDQNIKSML